MRKNFYLACGEGRSLPPKWRNHVELVRGIFCVKIAKITEGKKPLFFPTIADSLNFIEKICAIQNGIIIDSGGEKYDWNSFVSIIDSQTSLNSNASNLEQNNMCYVDNEGYEFQKL